MENEVNMLMVFCAATAALALGVMLGYMCCKTLFDVLRFMPGCPRRMAPRPKPGWLPRFEVESAAMLRSSF